MCIEPWRSFRIRTDGLSQASASNTRILFHCETPVWLKDYEVSITEI